jgi:hypothetical protein
MGRKFNGKFDEVTDATLLPAEINDFKVQSPNAAQSQLQQNDLQCPACTFLNPVSSRGKSCQICGHALPRIIWFKDVVTWQNFFSTVEITGKKIGNLVCVMIF